MRMRETSEVSQWIHRRRHHRSLAFIFTLRGSGDNNTYISHHTHHLDLRCIWLVLARSFSITVLRFLVRQCSLFLCHFNSSSLWTFATPPSFKSSVKNLDRSHVEHTTSSDSKTQGMISVSHSFEESVHSLGFSQWNAHFLSQHLPHSNANDENQFHQTFHLLLVLFRFWLENKNCPPFHCDVWKHFTVYKRKCKYFIDKLCFISTCSWLWEAIRLDYIKSSNLCRSRSRRGFLDDKWDMSSP